MEEKYIYDVVQRELGIDLTAEQCEKLFHYYQMLIEKNKVMNLTRITEFKEVVSKHFTDSLSLIKAFDPNCYKKLRVLDMGCGAGLPGIPIKIVWPDCEMTMVDSVGKKLNFVREAAEQLHLSSVSVIHARAEDLARDRSFRESFDLCTSRAVANLATLSEYCLPFVKKDGFFISYKSGDSDEEIQNGLYAIQVMGGGEPELIRFTLEGMGRILVKIKKEKTTPKLYPRKAGIPSKEPIIH